MKRIFIGNTDIAHQIDDFKTGFQSLGYEVTTSVFLEPKFSLRKYDYSLDRILSEKKIDGNNIINRIRRRSYWEIYRKKIFKYVLENCDIVFFMWNSILNNNEDFKILKENGKKIITFFVGDDIRGINAMKQEFSEYKMRPIEFSIPTNDFILNNKLKYLRNAEKYSDLIYSSKNSSQLSLRPYNHARVPINIDMFTENNNQREIPLIIHSPSFQLAKGTKYVVKVIESLKNNNLNFEFKFIENIPYNIVKDYYSNADILIEQMLGPGGGKQSREALACGTIVVTNMSPDYNNFVDSDCPIIDANPDSLYDVLKELILNHLKRIEIARKGRNWVKKYHSNTDLCRNIINDLENESNPEVFPSFFRKKYVPPSKKEQMILNKWTHLVKDCDWYKKYVPEGERDGLIF